MQIWPDTDEETKLVEGGCCSLSALMMQGALPINWESPIMF